MYAYLSTYTSAFTYRNACRLVFTIESVCSINTNRMLYTLI